MDQCPDKRQILIKNSITERKNRMFMRFVFNGAGTGFIANTA